MSDRSSIEVAKLDWGDLFVPIVPAEIGVAKGRMEQRCRRRIEQNLGKVLAANDEDAVDAQVSRERVVFGCLVRSFPFDRERCSTPESEVGFVKVTAVLECVGELMGVVAGPPPLSQGLPDISVHSYEHGRNVGLECFVQLNARDHP